MKKLVALFVFLIPFTSAAQIFVDPHAAVGYNPAQGTHFRFGLDVGSVVQDRLRAGVGAYFSAGEEPEHDREFGVGPFVSYAMPLTSFLVASARQEINYVDLHDPVEVFGPQGRLVTHNEENGVASGTTVGLHLFFTPNFVLSGGYRLVMALSNDALDDDRSGAFVGFALGI